MRRLLRKRIPAGLALALVVGVLWWWAVLRLALAPEEAGPLEGAVAVGGWGLGLLPVHCVPGQGRGRPERGRRRVGGPTGGGGATRASTLHRSGEGSGPS